MKEIVGKAGISAKVICDSISEAGVRLITYEITYPRLVLSEVNTHRMLSKNSASSRAIPFVKMKEQLTGKPVRFGEANKGMQDKGEDYNRKVCVPVEYFLHGNYEIENQYVTPEEAWEHAKESALSYAQAFYEAGFAKQVYNRLTEPFQTMKTVLTGTEFENYFWLRNHEAADPTIAELARCMYEAREASVPKLLKAGEYHLPYVGTCISEIDNQTRLYFIEDEEGRAIFLPLEDAIKVSCARCAAVSFRNIEYGVEKSREVYERLVGDDRKHSSAFEHVASPMEPAYDGYMTDNTICSINLPTWPSTWQNGITHMDRNGQLWSGNFRGWIQYRKLIPGENYTKEKT